MAIIIPAASETVLLKFMLGVLTPGNQTYKLYTNTPNTADDTLTSASFTEMSTLGYAAKVLTKTSWAVAQNGAAQAEGTYAQQTWTFTTGTPVAVEGYYVTDATYGLLWFEPFASAKTVSTAGDQIIITPTLQGDTM